MVVQYYSAGIEAYKPNPSLLLCLQPFKKLFGGWVGGGGVKSDFGVLLWAKPQGLVLA